MNSRIDYHSHSTASDGVFGPEELVRAAVQAKVASLALTDHDTIAGIPEALAEAKQHPDFSLIPGIELEIQWTKGLFHLLVLNYDPQLVDEEQVAQLIGSKRRQRNEKIKKAMRDHGIAIDAQLEKLDIGSSLGRPHFARALVAAKVARDMNDAFQRFLTPGGPFYYPKEGILLPEAIDLAKQWKGTTIIAHPTSLSNDSGTMVQAVHTILDAGVQGLELYHPSVKQKDRELLASIAAGRTCYVSGGSDFHDPKMGHILGKSTEDRIPLLPTAPLINLPWL